MHQLFAVSRDTANTIDGVIPVIAGLGILAYGLLGTDKRTKGRIAGRMKVFLVVCGALVAVGGIVRLAVA